MRRMRAAFNGPFTTGDGLDGEPLTVATGDRRVRLGCHARSSTRLAEATPGFTWWHPLAPSMGPRLTCLRRSIGRPRGH
jgi:hypothetical protein